MYARIIEGRVAQITEALPELENGECALIVECEAEVREGWLFAGGACVPPPELTAEEVTAGINAGINAALDAQILALELRQHRAVRELALGDQGALPRLRAIDTEIAGLRGLRVAE